MNGSPPPGRHRSDGAAADAGAAPGRVPTIVGPPLFFIHIMKTAGTSFRMMLEDALGADAVYPSTLDLAALPHGWYPDADVILRNLASIQPHRVLVGHFSAAMLDALPRGYRGITFLRDPLRRSLSNLRFASRVRGVPLESLMDHERFIATSIRDYQSRVLSMQAADAKALEGPVDDAMLAVALERLESLDFVGITERFAESCGLFDRCFGTSVATLVRHENVGGESGDDLDELVPRLLPLIERDRILYDRAVRLLESRLQAGRTAAPGPTATGS